MTLQQLKYAIEIAARGSFNEAAKHLFISQPSLSNSIKELEAEIDIKIFKRTSKGISVSIEGAEFLGYARQILEQTELLERRYLNAKPSPQYFAVSTQHYAFSVSAFVNLMKKYALEEYEFILRETKTFEVLNDVKNLRSEIGVLYMNGFNYKVINKVMEENNLKFTELFKASPHVFISKGNPLAKHKRVSLKDLEPYPCLSFEQGDYNSFHFSEEILSTLSRQKNIHVSDRATLFNLLIGLNGYTISTGVLSARLNGRNIIAVPLDINETINVGWISHKNVIPSRLALAYVKELNSVIKKATGIKGKRA